MAEDKQSIYAYMLEQSEGGYLPSIFLLPEDREGDEKFKPDGAIDGIAVYTDTLEQPTEETTLALQKALLAAAYEEYDKADGIILGLTQHAACYVDWMQDYVKKNAPILPAPEMYLYAMHLLGTAKQRELVKVGLILTELFGDPTRLGDAGFGMKEMLRLLAQSDEFTLFVLFNMRHWENGNDEIFHAAKHVRGWGRIHAVKRVESSTPAIADWLLEEGLKNAVGMEYTVLDCFIKGHVVERVRARMSDEDFALVTNVMNAMTMENGKFLNELEDVQAVIRDYLGQFSERELSDTERETAKALREYAANELDDAALVTFADAIIAQECGA